ncbi:MAG TPA: EamA family transporter, partial [Stellaceae bacterium]|nr:EamA family transporter [Stellaceae bacterium]
MSERVGVIAAVVSSSLGGMGAAATRYVIDVVDPVTLAAFRFGLGALLLVPVALAMRSPWPRGRDWLGAIGLGLLFFALFFVLYNVSLAYTTAA